MATVLENGEACIREEFPAEELVDSAAAGAPGLHYITLNRSTAAIEIHRNVLNSTSTQHALAAPR